MLKFADSAGTQTRAANRKRAEQTNSYVNIQNVVTFYIWIYVSVFRMQKSNAGSCQSVCRRMKQFCIKPQLGHVCVWILANEKNVLCCGLFAKLVYCCIIRLYLPPVVSEGCGGGLATSDQPECCFKHWHQPRTGDAPTTTCYTKKPVESFWLCSETKAVTQGRRHSCGIQMWSLWKLWALGRWRPRVLRSLYVELQAIKHNHSILQGRLYNM